MTVDEALGLVKGHFAFQFEQLPVLQDTLLLQRMVELLLRRRLLVRHPSAAPSR